MRQLHLLKVTFTTPSGSQVTLYDPTIYHPRHGEQTAEVEGYNEDGSHCIEAVKDRAYLAAVTAMETLAMSRTR